MRISFWLWSFAAFGSANEPSGISTRPIAGLVDGSVGFCVDGSVGFCVVASVGACVDDSVDASVIFSDGLFPVVVFSVDFTPDGVSVMSLFTGFTLLSAYCWACIYLTPVSAILSILYAA